MLYKLNKIVALTWLWMVYKRLKYNLILEVFGLNLYVTKKGVELC